MAIDVREVVASVRSLLGGGAAFIIGNSLLGIALPLRMEAATLHTTQSRSGSSPVRSRPRIAIASARPAEVVRSGDDRRPGASLTPAPMRPPVPMPVSIYRPAGSAVQSGRANTKRWVLEFEPTSPPEIEPLMGWLASMDTQKQVRLMFPTRGSAVAFADRHGWDYTVYEPRERTVSPKSYAEQFTRGITKAAAQHGACDCARLRQEGTAGRGANLRFRRSRLKVPRAVSDGVTCAEFGGQPGSARARPSRVVALYAMLARRGLAYQGLGLAFELWLVRVEFGVH